MGASFGTSKATLQPPNGQGGRKLASSWPEFVAELCYFIHSDGIPEGQGTEGTDTIIEQVLTRLSERGIATAPARSTVQPAVNAVLRRLRADN